MILNDSRKNLIKYHRRAISGVVLSGITLAFYLPWMLISTGDKNQNIYFSLPIFVFILIFGILYYYHFNTEYKKKTEKNNYLLKIQSKFIFKTLLVEIMFIIIILVTFIVLQILKLYKTWIFFSIIFALVALTAIFFEREEKNFKKKLEI
jgi:cell division protein FtsW (lipid II flippase)